MDRNRKRYDPKGTLDKKILSNVERVLNSGRLYRYDCSSSGESEVALLEKDFSELIGSRYALAVNSCSSSIFLALVCSGVKPGDKVLIPAFTFVAVPSAVVHAGAVPVLVEIKDNYTLDTADLRRKITDDTKFLLLSYMRGHVPDMDEVMSICKEKGVVLIEDCAHSLGVSWNGTPTGRFGKAGCFSMQSYKLIDGGEGGVLVTDDEELIARAILYAGSYEKLWKKHCFTPGNLPKIQKTVPSYNLRMSNLTASVIRPQLSMIGDRIEKYNEKYDVLTGILSQSEHIFFPKRESKATMVGDSVQFNLRGLTIEQMRNFVEICNENGVPMSIFGMGDDNARCYWNWNFLNNKQHLPRTMEILQSACDMRLPLHLSIEDITYLSETIVSAITWTKEMQLAI